MTRYAQMVHESNEHLGQVTEKDLEEAQIRITEQEMFKIMLCLPELFS